MVPSPPSLSHPRGIQRDAFSEFISDVFVSFGRLRNPCPHHAREMCPFAAVAAAEFKGRDKAQFKRDSRNSRSYFCTTTIPSRTEPQVSTAISEVRELMRRAAVQ